MLAAVALVEEVGWAGLSPKSLADRLGVHSTAIYRHFASWDDVVVAVFDRQVVHLWQASQDHLPSNASPRERLLALMRAFRAAANGDPYVADCLASILNAGEVGRTPNSDGVTAWVVDRLEEWGVPTDRVPQIHQALESLIIGGILCDYAGHPDHVARRRQRRRLTGIPAFEEFSRTDEACAQVGVDAFELTARLLLDECERMATTTRS